MKVVPYNKRVGMSWTDWKNMYGYTGQEMYVVRKIRGMLDGFVLSFQYGEEVGDYFMASDFEPCAEKKVPFTVIMPL